MMKELNKFLVEKLIEENFDICFEKLILSYKERDACVYYEGYEPYVLFAKTYPSESYSYTQLKKELKERMIKDINQGYKERMTGWYDKWYRYNRSDEGLCYDLGVKEAVKDPKCAEEMHIIEEPIM